MPRPFCPRGLEIYEFPFTHWKVYQDNPSTDKAIFIPWGQKARKDTTHTDRTLSPSQEGSNVSGRVQRSVQDKPQRAAQCLGRNFNTLLRAVWYYGFQHMVEKAHKLHPEYHRAV